MAYSIQLEQRLARNRILMAPHYGVRYSGSSNGEWEKKIFPLTRITSMLSTFSMASIIYRVEGRQYPIRTVVAVSWRSIVQNRYSITFSRNTFSVFYNIVWSNKMFRICKIFFSFWYFEIFKRYINYFNNGGLLKLNTQKCIKFNYIVTKINQSSLAFTLYFQLFYSTFPFWIYNR